MKKIFTLSALMATALMASANDYTDTMVTYTAGFGQEMGTSEQTLTLTQNEDGTYKMEFLNWIYTGDYGTSGEGSITVDGLTGENEGGITTINFDGTITANKGNQAGISMWNLAFMGSATHAATILIKFTDDKAYMEIDVQSNGMNGGGAGIFGTDEFEIVSLNQIEAATSGITYNLMGQKSNATSGLMIKDGKKMIVK